MGPTYPIGSWESSHDHGWFVCRTTGPERRSCQDARVVMAVILGGAELTARSCACARATGVSPR
jgi:hypothetical protein